MTTSSPFPNSENFGSIPMSSSSPRLIVSSGTPNSSQFRPVFWGDSQIGYVDKNGTYHGSTVDGDGNIVPSPRPSSPIGDFLQNLWDLIRKPTQQELYDWSNSKRNQNGLLDLLFPPAFAGGLPSPSEDVNRDFGAARSWTRPKDPLVFDLGKV